MNLNNFQFFTFGYGGDTFYDSNGYRIHTFKNSGIFTVTNPGLIDVLIVGGGAGGGVNVGGGGGGVLITLVVQEAQALSSWHSPSPPLYRPMPRPSCLRVFMLAVHSTTYCPTIHSVAKRPRPCRQRRIAASRGHSRANSSTTTTSDPS